MDFSMFLAPLAGGLLIGAAASFYMLANGRIAGISGMVEQALTPGGDDRASMILFLAGLVLSSILYKLAVPEAGLQVTKSLPVLVAAGLLVGFGTRLGSGCTSGHGVCGLARFSPRSLVSTLVFMATAGVTVYVTRHVLGG